MSISFPSDIEDRLTNLVAEGRFQSQESALREAIRLLEEQERQHDLLKVQLKVGLDELDRGALLHWSAELSEQLRTSARRRLALGEKPNPDVCP